MQAELLTIFFKIKNQIDLPEISIIHKNLQDVIDSLWKNLLNINYKVTIVFAPACASFDQFENFEERGKFFKTVVNEMATA